MVQRGAASHRQASRSRRLETVPPARGTTGRMGASSRWVKPTLVGALVTLRAVASDDAEPMWEMVNDPEGNDLTDTTATFTYDQIREWCATRSDQDDRLDLAIVENAT